MTTEEILQRQLEITRKHYLKAIETIRHLHSGKKLAPLLETDYWRELENLPAIGGEVIIDNKPITQLVKEVKTEPREPRGKGGPEGWVWVQKEGCKPTMITEASLEKYKKNGWVEGSGKIWVNNGKVNRKITMDELEEFKRQGFVRGKINRTQ